MQISKQNSLKSNSKRKCCRNQLEKRLEADFFALDGFFLKQFSEDSADSGKFAVDTNLD